MLVATGHGTETRYWTDRTNWPPQVEMVMSAMDAASDGESNRRQLPRMSYRVRAALKLFCDVTDAPAWLLYTRDANERGLGFLTPHRLPLGYGGLVSLVSPQGTKVSIACTLYRCREAAPGWFEGSLHFNREQWEFAADGNASAM